ncbi:MAG: beta strand repeat-containing protein, partial [Ilumatobacteraceae bacterium]
GTITTLNSTTGTITNLTGTAGTITTFNSTTGTITNLTGTAATITNISGTAGTITTFNSTTGTITNLSGTGVTFTNITGTAGTITTLNSTTGTITNLTGTGATITNISGTAGTITTLNSTNGTITNLSGTAGTITTLNSTTGTITNLTGTAATITNITGTAGTITTLEANRLTVNQTSLLTGISTFKNRVIFDSTNSIQIPVGTTAQRDIVGVAVTGQIRYNSEYSTFEGFGPGNSWGSLGGVKDVDGNTYIIPETSPGANENTLYFVANNVGVASLSETQFDLNVPLNVDGFSELDNVNISGTATVTNLRVNSDFNVYDTTATFHNDLYVAGNITIGGTTAFIAVNELVVSDKDIVVGYTTNVSGADASTDTTASSGGIAVASTEGTPLISMNAGGEITPDTYKQLMWFKSGAFSGLSTDAWIMNYGLGIGITEIASGVRLAVGGMTVTDTTVTSPSLSITNGTITNITGTSGTITNLTGTAATITNITGTAGTITTFNSTTGTITNLTGTAATITNITGTAGTITTFNSTTGTITNLTGTGATITNISGTAGTITT